MRKSDWKPFVQNLVERFGEDAVRVEYPLDPDTKKHPINAKRMEALLAQKTFESLGHERSAALLDKRQLRLGAAKALVKKVIKKARATQKQPKETVPSKKSCNAWDSDEDSTDDEGSSSAQDSSELSSATKWCILAMDASQDDAAEGEHSVNMLNPYVYEKPKANRLSRAERMAARNERKEQSAQPLKRLRSTASE